MGVRIGVEKCLQADADLLYKLVGIRMVDSRLSKEDAEELVKRWNKYDALVSVAAFVIEYMTEGQQCSAADAQLLQLARDALADTDDAVCDMVRVNRAVESMITGVEELKSHWPQATTDAVTEELVGFLFATLPLLIEAAGNLRRIG